MTTKTATNTTLALEIKKDDGVRKPSPEWVKQTVAMVEDRKVLQRYGRAVADYTFIELAKKTSAAALAMLNDGVSSADLGSDLNHFTDKMPLSSTGHARALADMIGFAIMPWDYLDRRFYPRAHQIGALVDQARADECFVTYVMAPLSGYSMANHVSSKSDMPVFVPEDAAQAFMAVDMSVPLFRAMHAQIGALQNRVDGLEQQQRKLAADVAAMADRLNVLQSAMATHRAEPAQVGAVEAFYGSPDPLLLILPRGKTIRSDCHMLVGPCWGELPGEVASILLKGKKSLARHGL